MLVASDSHATRRGLHRRGWGDRNKVSKGARKLALDFSDPTPARAIIFKIFRHGPRRGSLIVHINTEMWIR